MGDVEAATRREIDDLRVEPVAAGMVAVALSLAMALDQAEAPTSAAAVARELRATLQELRRISPPATKGDSLDELTAKRAQRRGA